MILQSLEVGFFGLFHKEFMHMFKMETPFLNKFKILNMTDLLFQLRKNNMLLWLLKKFLKTFIFLL